MRTQTIAGGALALLLLTGSGFADDASSSGHKGLLADLGLSSLWGGKKKEAAPAVEQPAPVRTAQAGDPRVTQLEEEIRRLSGTIEEMNFQILQMQEQMRKQQEDMEFRLQELEGGGAAKPASSAKPAKKSETTPVDGGKPAQGVASASPDDQPASDPGAATAVPNTTTTVPADQAQATAPGGDAAAANDPTSKPLGTITFDAAGAVTGGSVGDQTVVSRGAESSPDGTTVASLPKTDDPEQSYKNAYEFILSGNYPTAEAGFREHIARFPKDPRAADSQFWLGESLLGQEKYREAAEVFLTASKTYPKSRKAPDMLLKLGVSLNGMNQHDVACATFGEVEKRYPGMSTALRARLKQERANAAC